MKTVRRLGKYVLVYLPEHPKAMKSKNWDGWVYEHIVIAEEDLGRALNDDEEVHHLDLNGANNSPNNLLVLTSSGHAKLHRWLARIKYKPELSIEVRCEICEKPLKLKQRHYCSETCHLSGREKNSKMHGVDKKDVLIKLKTRPMISVCKDYNMSDNGLKKWLNKK